MKDIFLKIEIFLVVMAMLVVPLLATAQNNEKVTICHVTGSESNPYVKITISVNALEAHMSHGDFYPIGGVCSIVAPD